MQQLVPDQFVALASPGHQSVIVEHGDVALVPMIFRSAAKSARGSSEPVSHKPRTQLLSYVCFRTDLLGEPCHTHLHTASSVRRERRPAWPERSYSEGNVNVNQITCVFLYHVNVLHTNGWDHHIQKLSFMAFQFRRFMVIQIVGGLGDSKYSSHWLKIHTREALPIWPEQLRIGDIQGNPDDMQILNLHEPGQPASSMRRDTNEE